MCGTLVQYWPIRYVSVGQVVEMSDVTSAERVCLLERAPQLVASMPDVRSAIGLGRRLSVPWRRGDEDEEVTTYHKKVFYDIGEIYCHDFNAGSHGVYLSFTIDYKYVLGSALISRRRGEAK